MTTRDEDFTILTLIEKHFLVNFLHFSHQLTRVRDRIVFPHKFKSAMLPVISYDVESLIEDLNFLKEKLKEMEKKYRWKNF